jgi:hypothetical protein
MLLALLLALPVVLKSELRAHTAFDPASTLQRLSAAAAASMLRLLTGAPASMLRLLAAAAAAAKAALDTSKLCRLLWPAAAWPSKLVRRCCGCGGRCGCCCCCCWLLHAQKLLLAANC